MKLEIRITSDNSPTLYNEELNETYHSIHGARQESEHVYIKSGLEEFKNKDEVRIFEMGFGTGLNILLTKNYALTHQLKINVTSIELFPLPEEIWRKLTYPENEIEKSFFEKIHVSEWEKPVVLDADFTLTKLETSLDEVALTNQFDLIYFDAFGPDKQPHLWTIPIFEKLFGMLADGGVFVTYSAKGQVRRDLQTAGFTVERIPGPPGKREMLRGRKLPKVEL